METTEMCAHCASWFEKKMMRRPKGAKLLLKEIETHFVTKV
ncbi:hypothetical protein [Bacillus sp. ISL-46]|nr:hypothetical protein [Bacillus sp. ISL-46]